MVLEAYLRIASFSSGPVAILSIARQQGIRERNRRQASRIVHPSSAVSVGLCLPVCQYPRLSMWMERISVVPALQVDRQPTMVQPSPAQPSPAERTAPYLPTYSTPTYPTFLRYFPSNLSCSFPHRLLRPTHPGRQKRKASTTPMHPLLD